VNSVINLESAAGLLLPTLIRDHLTGGIMKKMIIWVLGICLLSTSAVFSDVSLTTYGWSPRDVTRDATGILDRAYNGLTNVGIETQLYLKGMGSEALTAPTWTILTAPGGSVAEITTTANLDEMTQVAMFTPDLNGKYIIQFGDGADAATLTLNAGTYVGIEDGRCDLCHSGIAEEWMETGHYSLFEEGLNGTAHDRYGEGCINCHTTGFDDNANNGGFDDHEFVFPDSLYESLYDEVVDMYPDAMEFARIQCESCHGPASLHCGTVEDSKMVSDLGAANCAWCHDDGTHHVYPEQWDYSGHANVPGYPGGGRTTCQGCHNGAQFVQVVNGEEITSQPPMDITCATCHDPHSEENPHQIRTLDVTLANGEVVEKGGLGKLCMNCHQGRKDAKTYVTGPDSHYGPHYAPQADMLLGTNAAEFGYDLQTSAHASAIENACVDCHMYPGHADDEDNVILVGSHTFNVVDPEGNDNVAICEDCHGNVGEGFDEKKFWLNGMADHDGDGVEEGLQDEVKGLMEILAGLLPHADSVDAYDPHDDPDSTWTQVELAAAFNYDFVYYDHSFGIHNPAYTVSLLQASVNSLLGIPYVPSAVEVDEELAVMPDAFELEQNFPNPFNPSTMIKYQIPEASEVRLAVFSVLGEEIKTLVEQRQAAGSYTVNWNATDTYGNRLTSGVYFYRIQAGTFTEMRKMILVK